MANFVLVHGAWGAAREFGGMARLLREAGHDVIAIDLPGHGDNEVPPSDVTFDAYVSEVVRAIEDAGKKVLLAGHSLGGAVISGVAERIPASIESWRVEKVYDLAAGHFPFVSIPRATAMALNDIDGDRSQ